ncbi:hypothetical protein [Tateyamaria sp.]|uniref:hypothetical protein n=1 Tax=Tateyamaria sp. TaxID=1929288 RepID=UPI003B2105AD
MTRFDVARTQQPKSTAAYGSLRFGPLRYQLKRTIGMLPTPDNSECSRQHKGRCGEFLPGSMGGKRCGGAARGLWLPAAVFMER